MLLYENVCIYLLLELTINNTKQNNDKYYPETLTGTAF